MTTYKTKRKRRAMVRSVIRHNSMFDGTDLFTPDNPFDPEELVDESIGTGTASNKTGE